MSAIGRWVCVAGGLADGVRETAVGSVVTGAGALAALLAAGAVVPVTGADASGVSVVAADAWGVVALEAGTDADAVDLTCAGDCAALDTVGESDPVGMAEAAGLVAVGLAATAVTMGDAWPADACPSDAWPSEDAVA